MSTPYILFGRKMDGIPNFLEIAGWATAVNAIGILSAVLAVPNSVPH